jgi:FtsZ-binding cell division protein ZapB
MSNYFESLLETAQLIQKDLDELKEKVKTLEQQASSSPFDSNEILLRLHRIEKKLELQE